MATLGLNPNKKWVPLRISANQEVCKTLSNCDGSPNDAQRVTYAVCRKKAQQRDQCTRETRLDEGVDCMRKRGSKAQGNGSYSLYNI